MIKCLLPLTPQGDSRLPGPGVQASGYSFTEKVGRQVTQHSTALGRNTESHLAGQGEKCSAGAPREGNLHSQTCLPAIPRVKCKPLSTPFCTGKTVIIGRCSRLISSHLITKQKTHSCAFTPPPPPGVKFPFLNCVLFFFFF